MKENRITQCEMCAYYDEDEEVCSINLDEDDVARYMSQSHYSARISVCMMNIKS